MVIEACYTINPLFLIDNRIYLPYIRYKKRSLSSQLPPNYVLSKDALYNLIKKGVCHECQESKDLNDYIW